MRSVRRVDGREIVAKLAAAAGAVALVLAFAIASLMTPFLTLGQLLTAQAPGWMANMAHGKPTGFASWLWENIGIPLLLRPAWMVPTMIGFVFVGLALQLRWGAKH